MLIFLILVILFPGQDLVLAGGDTPDSTSAQSTSLWNTIHGDSLQFRDFFRHLEKTEVVNMFYGLVILVIAFVLLMYLKRPLQRLGGRPTAFGRFLKKTTPVFLTLSWLMLLYLLIGFFINPDSFFSITLMVLTGFGIIIATRDVLQDLFAGIILPFESHFQEGRKIRIGEIFGEITRTGFRKTQIRLPDQSVTIIPNRILLKTRIDNIYEQKDNSPVSVELFLPYGTDLDHYRKLAYKAALVSPYLFLEKPVTVQFSTEATTGHPVIRMTVNAFLQKIDYQRTFASDLCEHVLKTAAVDLNNEESGNRD